VELSALPRTLAGFEERKRKGWERTERLGGTEWVRVRMDKKESERKM